MRHAYTLARRLQAADGRALAPVLLAAGVACVAAQPAKAKQGTPRQQVFVWGRGAAFPGGSKSDVLWPRRVEWFEQNPAGWKKLAFGPDSGAAVDGQGRLFVWGAGAHGTFVGPLEVDVQGDGRGQSLEDVQVSAKKMFALTARGDALVFEDFLAALQRRAAPAAAARKAAERAAQAEEEEKEKLEAEAKEAEAEAFAAEKDKHQPLRLTGTVVPGLPRAGWFSWLGGYRGCVKSMSIGLEHGCFVTYQGKLYCVGGNEWGQCGVAPPKQRGPMGAWDQRQHLEVEFPQQVEFPAGAAPIKSVEVGGRHTVAQDVKGKAYAFGDDRRIQLGLGDTRTGGSDERHSYGVIRSDSLGGLKVKSDIPRSVTYRYYDPHMQSRPFAQMPPQAVNRPAYPPASFFALGEDFSMGIFRDSPDWYAASEVTSVIFACGENGAGQCGRSLHQQQQVWSQVRLPKHSSVQQLRCGQTHCLALLKDGHVYSWGNSPQGQVGNGKRALAPKPSVVTQQPLLPEALAQLAPSGSPQTVTPQDLYKRAVYQHAASRKSNNLSGSDAPPAPLTVPLPGTVVAVACGFRSSAVICEVPE